MKLCNEGLNERADGKSSLYLPLPGRPWKTSSYDVERLPHILVVMVGSRKGHSAQWDGILDSSRLYYRVRLCGVCICFQQRFEDSVSSLIGFLHFNVHTAALMGRSQRWLWGIAKPIQQVKLKERLKLDSDRIWETCKGRNSETGMRWSIAADESGDEEVNVLVVTHHEEEPRRSSMKSQNRWTYWEPRGSMINRSRFFDARATARPRSVPPPHCHRLPRLWTSPHLWIHHDFNWNYIPSSSTERSKVARKQYRPSYWLCIAFFLVFQSRRPVILREIFPLVLLWVFFQYPSGICPVECFGSLFEVGCCTALFFLFPGDHASG